LSPARLFVAGDWGTTHLRLFLCRETQVLDHCEGPGISRLATDATVDSPSHTFLTTLSALLAPWMREHESLPVWLAGMIGSRNGWRETSYVSAPADAREIAAAVLRFDAAGLNIAIAPGLRCTNPLGAPDLMRGEETQICGALALHPQLAKGRRIIVLPGTHTKWALVDAGRIVTFQTTLSGELYGLLKDHSMLARASNAASLSPAAAAEASRAGFELGLARVRRVNDVPFTHLVFEARSRQIAGEWSQPQALGFLSGLLICQDVQGALTLFGKELDSAGTATVIGAPEVTDLYGRVLAAHAIHASVIAASDATIAGLHALMAASEAD
jgi:2-dehydro-3-deoxygalactonokinase